MRQVKISLLIAGTIVLFSKAMLADSSKISPDLLMNNSNPFVKVIVQYRTPPRASVLTSLPVLGGVVVGTVTTLNMLVLSLPLASLSTLAQSPEVMYISPDRPLTQLLDYSASAVNAHAAWSNGLTGLGVGVAVVDSGIAASPDLNSLVLLPRVVYHQSFVGTPGIDGFGHGTHVAGIIAANGASSTCMNCTRVLKGIAPNANLIDLQVLDASGQGSDSSVISAIGQAIQLKEIFNIRVINLSLGRPIYESYKFDPLCQAVEAAWKAGITVVVAAGNNGRDNSVGNQGYGTIQSPANDPYVITVGAMKAMGTYPRTDDLIASYSSKGPAGIDFVAKPDIVAPGNHVVSLESRNSTLASDPANRVPLSYYESTNSSAPSAQFIMLNGTSMATPVVSGAVADMLQGQPGLTPDQVKARLMKTAYKQFPTSSTAVDPVTGQQFTSYYDLFTIGAGYLDIAAALSNHDLATGTAMSPIANYSAPAGKVYLVFDPSSTWNAGPSPAGSQSVWGTKSVWGSTTVAPDQSVWGARSVWGTSTVDGFKAIWGSSGVWGTETTAGSSTVDGTKAIWGAASKTSDSDTVFTVNQ